MKTLSSIVKTLAIFLFVGALFFSCSVNDNSDYGTLVIKLPGNSARAGVSQQFTNTLSYFVTCKGPGNVSQKFSSGGTAALPLNAGDWNVTVEVRNAADEPIGLGTVESVVIEAGKTTPVEMPISIDTSRNRITKFAITGSVQSVRESTIVHGNEEENGTITVYVSPGTREKIYGGVIAGNVTITFTHTGVKADPPSGRSLSLAALEDTSITVTAENDINNTRTYNIAFEEIEAPPEGSFTITGLPSNVGEVEVLVFKLNTIKTFSDLMTPTAEDDLLAMGFTENGKDFILIDIKFTQNLGDGNIDPENFSYQDMLWKGNGKFDVIAITDESGFSRAQVSFTNGAGSVPWSSFSILEGGGSSGGGGYSENPFEERYPAAEFPKQESASEFIGTWKGGEPNDGGSYDGESYSLTFASSDSTGTWTLITQYDQMTESIFGRFLVSGNSVYFYSQNEVYPYDYFMSSWGSKTGNTLKMYGAMTGIGGGFWTKQ